MTDINVWAALGFIFAAYAVVGNDALQTLGTFINSNGRFHWSVLFGFAALILVATFTYGYVQNGGDPSFGRLADTKKYPPLDDAQWFHALPPLALLLLTRFGIPVSTSFMVLAIFATMGGLTKMMVKSFNGYGYAFVLGLGLYLVLARTLEAFFRRNEESQFGKHWVVLQWLSTTWLWAVWLMQDFANIFVFLPRKLNHFEAFGAMAIIVAMLAITFANRGGPVQRILKSKSAVTDIRSATIIDFTFAGLLYYFKNVSNTPMSTTWVFLGLIAGREFAFSIMLRVRGTMDVTQVALSDVGKAFLGLVISVDLARGLPAMVGGQPLWDDQAGMVFLIALNALLLPVGFFFLRKKDRTSSILMTASLAAGAAAFFLFPPA